MKPYDMSDPDERRRAYREQMLGVNRPQNASKKSTRMVDSLLAAKGNHGSYDAFAIGDDANAKSASFWAGRVKDQRKALLRYIGRMEYSNEETALMEEIIKHAVESCVPVDEEAARRMDHLVRDLGAVRQKAKDREA